MNKPETFAARMQKLLDIKNITKAELARKAGVSKSSITRYVKGDWEGKQDAVYKIATATDVSEAWLMGYDVPMERIQEPEPPAVSVYPEQSSSISQAFLDFLFRWFEIAEKTNRGLLELLDTLGYSVSKIREDFIKENPDPASKHYVEWHQSDMQLIEEILGYEITPQNEKAIIKRKNYEIKQPKFDMEACVLIERVLRLSKEDQKKISALANEMLEKYQQD